jgi:hypothetical protein
MTPGEQGVHELDTEERNAMSDSEYAFPRERKEPLNDASHVRNAIARFDQVKDVTDEERRDAFERIRRAAQRFGVEMTETRWQDLGRPARGERSRDDLYAEARRRNIKGRSNMTKAQLQRALSG